MINGSYNDGEVRMLYSIVGKVMKGGTGTGDSPVLVEFDIDSPLLFPPHPKCVVKCYSKEDQRCRGVNQGLSEVLDVRSPQSAVSEKYGA